MLAAARFAYLWDRPDKGARYLKEIAEAYFTLGILRDTAFGFDLERIKSLLDEQVLPAPK